MPPHYGAAEQQYCDAHRLADLFDDLCAELLTTRPADPRAHLAEYLKSAKCTEHLAMYPGAKGASGGAQKGPPPAPPAKSGAPPPPVAKGPPAAPAGKGKGGKGGAPPPPPPPPPKDFHEKLFGANAEKKKDSGKVDMSAVFAELSKGTDVTKGLRKVKDSEKTHKNRDKQPERGATDFSELERKKAARQAELEAKRAAGQVKKVKDPVFTLDGKRWLVENQMGTKLDMKMDEIAKGKLQMGHAVCLHGCENYMLAIDTDAKINAVTVTECKNVQVQFGDILSAVEVNKSQKVTLFCRGELQSLMADKTTELYIHATEKSRNMNITTCAVTASNISYPPETGGKIDSDADPLECALPEQFKTKILVGAGGKPTLETEPAVHAD